MTISEAWRDDFVDVLAVSDSRDSAGPEVWIQFSSAALTGPHPTAFSFEPSSGSVFSVHKYLRTQVAKYLRDKLP